MNHTLKKNGGQALLTVIFVAVIGILITTGALYALLNNINTATLGEIGAMTHSAADSGIENALIRLIRDPTYTGETLQIDGRTVVVTVTGTGTQTVIATATDNTITQRVAAVVRYTGGVLTIDSWSDVP